MVFYRKYRPQTIGELDNESVRESLYSIFSKGEFAHAFLFTGPKGLGKTSTARIVAKVINCEKHKGVKSFKSEKDIEPDNKCEECISITNGNNLDVLEIDGASNRGIDEIRDLREKIKLSPFKASKKVYIIDEVHMLTTEAFNALLKTLEEPPSHTVFVLCTTEYQKVPETIASRCFRINFTKATSEELVRSLSRIVKAEDIKIEKDALFEIGKLADGSFRDAAKILEEVATFTGKKNITSDLVSEKYNTLGIGKSVSEFLESLHKKDIKKSLEICRKLTEQGMDFKYFIQSLIERLHFMLLVKVGVEKGEILNFSTDEIKKLFEILSDAYNQTKYSVLPQLPLEIVALEWGNVLDSDRGPAASFPPASTPSSLVNSNEVRAVGNPSTRVTPNVSNSDNFFSKLINEVKVQNHLIAALLRSCKGDEVRDGILNITASSKFHKEKLEDEKTMKILEEFASKLSGKNIKIQITLKGVN